MKQPLWKPSKDKIKSSNMYKYLQYAESFSGKKFPKFNDLYSWSVSDIEKFWESIWNYSEVVYSKNYKKVLENLVMPGAKWFTESRLNFAENLLRYTDDKTAIISSREDAPSIRITYSELNLFVARTSASLKEMGLKKVIE
jgi:acetoacetyl-CoA synthetase